MNHKVGVSLLIALLVFVIASTGYALGAFDKPELFAYDVQARLLRSAKPVDSHIKVILVDEAALKSMNEIAGRWPWPRAIWSDLLDFMEMGGARAVLFDILFLERQDKTNDTVLRNSTRDFQHAYHSMMIGREQADSGVHARAESGVPLPQQLVQRFALNQVTGSLKVEAGAENNSYSLPVTGLAEVSQGVAVVDLPPTATTATAVPGPCGNTRENIFRYSDWLPSSTAGRRWQSTTERSN